jgi:hypothetical protein
MVRPVTSFDPMLAPEVTVCEWSGTSCGATVARFSTTAGHGSAAIRMEPGSERYIVNPPVPERGQSV